MKNKKVRVIAATSALGLLLLVGGGILLATHKSGPSAQELADQAATRANETSAQTEPTANTAPAATSQAVPIGAAAPAKVPAQSSSTLKATSNAGTSGIGQLNTTNQSGSTNQNQGAGSTSTNTQSNPFDPSTYQQYDKYKDDKAALLGDAQTGTGATLEAGKKAVVYYRGWLTNGSLFDQSRADANGQMQSFSFTVGAHQVIAGWEQGLVGMKVGGVRLLIVPPAVGYGAAGQGSIPPNSLLVFQVQLVDVQ
jgi:FKBP-type peptidyl-prolyl cis-trans isomerase FkpA